ncbi:MAG: hypothetical protein ACRENX_10700, partial [Candidatus Dormibacteria bacterium]
TGQPVFSSFLPNIAGHLEVMVHSLADVTTTAHSPTQASVPLHTAMTLVGAFRLSGICARRDRGE